MGAVAQKIEAELALWADPEEVGTPDGRKRFDVCDLRIWLKLVDAAGVPAVPATEVASLSEGELEALVGFVEVPAALRDRISKGLAEGAADGVSQQDAESLAVIAESFFQKPISAGAAGLPISASNLPWMTSPQVGWCGPNILARPTSKRSLALA